MKFLDARTAQEKLEVLDEADVETEIDERLLNNIEASLDIVGTGDIEKRLDFIRYHLRIHAKYETPSSRLR